ETLPQPLLIEYLPGHQTQYRANENFREEFVAGNLDLADTILIVFFDINRDVVAIDRFPPKRNRYAERKRRPDERQRLHHLVRLGLNNRIENIGADVAVFGIEHPNSRDIVRQLEIKVGVLPVEYRQRAGFFDQLHRLFEFAIREDLITLN